MTDLPEVASIVSCTSGFTATFASTGTFFDLTFRATSAVMLASVQSRCHTGITPFQQPTCRLVRRSLALQRQTICSAQRPQPDQAESAVRRFAMPLTAAVAAALIISAGAPDEALAARSGGRVGGSSFRSARPAPAPRAPSGGG